MKIIVLPLLALLFLILELTTQNPQDLCLDETNYWVGVYRDFIHVSLGHLAWTLFGLYSLWPLEVKLGSFWTIVAIIWMLILTNYIQFRTKKIMKPFIDNSQHYQYLRKFGQIFNINITQLPCDLGFLGINMALSVLVVYLTTRGYLINSWQEILWVAFQIIPTLMYTNVTLHGQISGFTAGMITVFLLSYLGIGIR